MSKFDKILEQLPTKVVLSHGSDRDGKITAVFTFSEEGFGFGELALVQTTEGVFLDSEGMSKDHVLRLLTTLVESAVTDDDEDHVNHLNYNKAMGRRCSECLICYPEDNGL